MKLNDRIVRRAIRRRQEVGRETRTHRIISISMFRGDPGEGNIKVNVIGVIGLVAAAAPILHH